MLTQILISSSRRLPSSFTSTFGFKPNLSIFRNVTSSALQQATEFVGVVSDIQDNGSDHLLSIIHDCSDAPLLRQGRQVHAQIVTSGVWGVSLYGTRLLSMYVLCGSIVDARSMFFQLDRRYTLPWNWMIRGFTVLGWFKLALLLYFKMLGMSVVPDKYTFPYVIKACCSFSDIKGGRLIHQRIQLMGLEMDGIIGSSLIKMYAEHGSIADARQVFDLILERDTVSWNVMIYGYAANKDVERALELFCKMRVSKTKPNSVSFASALSVCAWGGKIEYGSQLHGLVIKYGFDSESSVANTLLAMYSKCRRLEDSHKLLDIMPQADLVAWNGMIAGLVQNGCSKEAMEVFYKMQSSGLKPDSFTFASFLPSISETTSLKHGKEIHGYIIRHILHMDAFLKSALIDLYFKCREVDMAVKVFNTTLALDVVICCSMISGYVLNGMNSLALQMFRHLLKAQIKPNPIALASILPACAFLAALRLGQELHGYTIKNEMDKRCYVGSSLMDMYAKCGKLSLSHYVFQSIEERDSVLWNTMIVNFSQNGQPKDAISLFRQMGSSGAKHDCVTLSAALSACANIPAMLYGKEIHGFIVKGPWMSDLFAQSTLIDMYAKCGCLNLARQVFDLMLEKNEVAWNGMVAAYGTHGFVKDAFSLFHEMVDAGVEPDHITFLSIMSACGHAGKVDEGLKYFQLMTDEYGIDPRMEHYACMVDLFGRAGQLDEAFDIINSMPFKPDAGVWGAMLGACKVHGNMKLAELASRHLLELEPENSGYYVLMSNIHAVSGRWDGVSNIRNLMKDRRVEKVPGYSWIEVNNTTHMFGATDNDHSDSGKIYLLLEHLYIELQEAGYIPQTDFSLRPI